MNDTVHSRSVLRLVALQGRGRLRRMGRRFLLPRRMILSLLAFLLAAAWLGNAAMTVWLRESASPDLLRAMVGLGLAFYAIWHLAMAACFRPQQCLEWIATEREILEACPLRPGDLLVYKLASVATTTFLKSLVLALLLLPDLGNVPIALAGILLAMLFLELWRMGVEIFVWGMSRHGFLAYRIGVVIALFGLSGTIAATVADSPLVHGEVRLGAGVMSQVVQLLLELDASVVGWIRTPFSPLVNLVCTTELTWGTLLNGELALGMVMLAAALVFWLFSAMPLRVVRRERAEYRPDRDTDGSGEYEAAFVWRNRPIGRWGPTGAIAWRQWLGSRRYAGSLLTALVIPGIMALTPMFVLTDPRAAFLSTAGALAFYTFLLLPTALRFDFRRDLDRLALFKSLPIAPRALIVGQLATPIWISCLFQATVLAVAAVVLGQSLLLVLGTILVLTPMNVLVFALDNLIFLLYPYRMQQEGMEIFLRTMLTFTGKGLLFVLGLGLVSVWGMGAALLAHAFANQMGTAPHGYAVFSMGLLLGLGLVSWGLVLALGFAYQRLNPIEDIPR